MRSINKFFFAFLLVYSFSFFSQSKSGDTNIKKQYQYSFNGQLNNQDITALENKLASLEFVTMAKIKYKPDSGKGELFLQTSERMATSESDKGFDLIELKKLLISNNLSPIELTSITLD